MQDLRKHSSRGAESMTHNKFNPDTAERRADKSTDWSSVRSLLIPLSVVAVVGGCVFLATQNWDRWTAGSAYQSTDNTYVRAEFTRLSSRVSGNVSRIAVSDFQHVKKGDLLLEIEPADYQVKVLQAKASLDAVSAQLENLSNQEKLQQAAVQQAEAQLQAVNVSAQLAKQEAVGKGRCLKPASQQNKSWSKRTLTNRRPRQPLTLQSLLWFRPGAG